MKILFVYQGRYQIRDAITMEYLSAIAKRYGYDTDLTYDQDVFGVTDNVLSVSSLSRIFSNDERLIKNIVKKNPQAVVFLDGFTRTKFNNQISDKIKKRNQSIISIGLFCCDPNSSAGIYDYILIGEPELSFERFLKENNFNAKKGKYRFSELADLDKLPFPDKSLFAPFINFKDSYMLYTSKGCLYQCSYCEETIYQLKLGDNYFRRKSAKNVILELEKAKEEFNIREVIYKDSLFAWNKAWLGEFLKLYRQKIDLPYKCFAKAENFDDEIALMFKDSKCYCVEFGVQTFNEKLKRDILKRDEKNDTLLNAFSICDKYRLRYDVDHIFGIPGEKTQDHIESAKIYAKLKYVNRIKCHNLAFYKDSSIYKYAPPQVREKEDYSAEFFSSVVGEEGMIEVNKIFQKYFKILPLLPRRLNIFILNGKRWKIFRYVPFVFILLLMLALAIKNKDRRFGFYFIYYPRKLKKTFLGK